MSKRDIVLIFISDPQNIPALTPKAPQFLSPQFAANQNAFFKNSPTSSNIPSQPFNNLGQPNYPQSAKSAPSSLLTPNSQFSFQQQLEQQVASSTVSTPQISSVVSSAPSTPLVIGNMHPLTPQKSSQQYGGSSLNVSMDSFGSLSFPVLTNTQTKDPYGVPLSPQSQDQFREFQVQPVQQEAASTQLLNKINSFFVSQQEQLGKIMMYQKQVLLNPTKEGFDAVHSQHEILKKQLDQELQALYDLERTVLLTPPELKKWISLTQNLFVQNLQLELYHQELQQLLQKNVPQRWYLPFTPIANLRLAGLPLLL